MEGLLAAKRALAAGRIVYANGQLAGGMLFRVIRIRREGATYYGLSAADNIWYPIDSVHIHSDEIEG